MHTFFASENGLRLRIRESLRPFVISTPACGCLQVVFIHTRFLAGGVDLEQIRQQESAGEGSQHFQRPLPGLKQERQSGQQRQDQMGPEYKLDRSLPLLPSGSG